MSQELKPVQTDSWEFLQKFTDARIALGRAGTSLPTKELLDFRLAHAQAKDAVYSSLDKSKITEELNLAGLEYTEVRSLAGSRDLYLKNPDSGRKLDIDSLKKLELLPKNYTCCFIIADGLSANAVNRHSVELLKIIIPQLKAEIRSIAPVIIAEQSRVALSDQIGSVLQAEIAVILIGERPGLTAPDSMGAYITYRPEPGLTDERRNCISNIRPEGLSYQSAAEKLYYLLTEMKILKISGIGLKDRMDEILINPKVIGLV